MRIVFEAINPLNSESLSLREVANAWMTKRNRLSPFGTNNSSLFAQFESSMWTIRHSAWSLLIAEISSSDDSNSPEFGARDQKFFYDILARLDKLVSSRGELPYSDFGVEVILMPPRSSDQISSVLDLLRSIGPFSFCIRSLFIHFSVSEEIFVSICRRILPFIPYLRSLTMSGILINFFCILCFLLFSMFMLKPHFPAFVVHST